MTLRIFIFGIYNTYTTSVYIIIRVNWYYIALGDNYEDKYEAIGPGHIIKSTIPPASGKLPDFITSKVTMGNKDGKYEKYTWKINEAAYVHDYIDNIGTADWEGKAKKIKAPFYLSKGSKEDSHSE